MNQQLHRLVFSRRHGMLVAVAEHARAGGKSAPGECPGGTAARLARPAAAPAAHETSVPFSAPATLTALAALLALAVAPAPALAQTRPPVVFAGKAAAPAARLPVPYANSTTPRPFVYDPSKGSASADLAAAGRVGWSVSGNTATFDQGSEARVVVNWDSFNIGAGYKVHFTQDKDPAKYVSALNRIWSADPSLIFGSLTADREVILLNANGVYFGRGARVDTGKFVATSLAIADSVFDKGLRNVIDGSAVFSTAGTNYLPTNLDSAVTVEAGAELRSAAGGDVLLIAPRVVNQGRIETPGGQAVLAAGDKVYLMSSSDPKQRGLIVAVDPVKMAGTNSNDSTLGIVENAASGSYKTVNGATVDDSTPDSTSGLVNRINEIRAESGTVNLVGLGVRQNGLINASTAVKGANGAIYLQAMASTAALPGGLEATTPASRRGLTIEAGAVARVGALLGTVQFGAGSVTAVLPESGGATQIDAEAFNPSIIRVEGSAIHVAGEARIEAPSGNIELLAARDGMSSPLFDSGLSTPGAPDDGSRIVVAPGAHISVAGVRGVEVDGARNQGAQRLFRIELADAPVQRDGPLYRSEVFFDLRDGSKVTAANVTGAAAAVQRSASERSTSGGSLRLEAEGAVVVGDDAQLDASGGTVEYSAAVLGNSLIDRNGRVVVFKGTDGSYAIDGLLDATQHLRLPAYTEGKDGGSVSISGRQMAINGSLRGEVVEGELQRDGRAVRAAPGSLQVGRQVGSDLFYLPELRLGASSTGTLNPGIFSDPLGGALDGIPEFASLSLASVSQGGFGSLVLRAGKVNQPEYATLQLGVQGKLDIRADTIALSGNYSAPGGSLSLATVRADPNPDQSAIGNIHLSGDTVLSTAGLWTNDTAAAKGSVVGSVQTGGGRVAVQAARSLVVDPGASLDVSAGARLAANGRTSLGAAGSIALGIGRSELFRSELAIAGVAMAGFDFAGGGSLSIGAPELTVATGTASGFTLAPEFFSQGGFGNIAVTAFGDVRITSGTDLQPVLRNWQLAPGYRYANSGPLSAASVLPQQLDERLAERRPVSLALAAGRTLNPSIGLAGSSLVVERGAAIHLEPGANLALSATRNLEVGVSGGAPGSASVLSAPAGQIVLAIKGTRGVSSATETNADTAGFLGDQVLWLGADARVSADGTARLRPDAGPVYMSRGGARTDATPIGERTTGSVYGGGGITLQAQRGYVVADAGSVMSVDGASAELNLPGLAAPVRVARAAGSVTVSSPEGFVLDGAVSAHAPRNAAGMALADGGRLDLSVGLGGVYTITAGTLYPGSLLDLSGQPIPGAQPRPRQLVVDEFAGLLQQRGVAYGQDLRAALDNGIGYVPAALLRDAGFDALRLGAGDRLQFDASLSLDKPLKIELDAPALAGRGGVDVALKAAYLSLGDSSLSRIGSTADASAAGVAPGTQASLHLQAPIIEVFGNSGLQGFSQVQLDAGAAPGGEVRLTSLTPTNLLAEDASRWTLNFAGQLDITAGQLGAATGAKFTLQGLSATDAADPGSRLTVRTGAGGAAPQMPLSVFGSLTANATDIVQQGVVRQPFGAIALNAERSLTLGEGSITSVSAQGSTLIYGETTNLSQWLAGTSYATRLPVDKTVSLAARTLTTAATATVDASGGGEVKAWEFFPGVGGGKDYFETSGLYAVLPDYAQAQAAGFTGGRLDPALQGRQIVVGMDGAGLPRGTYTLLPARYALLGGSLPQGAFLVRRAADQGRAVLSAPLQLDDGSAIVTAYLREAGSSTIGVSGERFVVEPMSTFQAKSDVRLTGISDLLAGASARLGATQPPPLPRDGGRVQAALTGTERSTWQAAVKLGADGGRAGLLDVSATQLALVDDLAKTAAGTLGISAQVITDSGAGSVLLGGRRSLVAGAGAGPTQWTVDQSGTRTLVVDLGQQVLSVEELILAASGSVRLAEGTRLSAATRGTVGASTLTASGDGVLAVVGANRVEIARQGGALAAGDLSIGAGSQLAGAQISMDATGSLSIDPSVALRTGALELAARGIVVGGETAADPRATLLSGELLAAARLAPSLTLRSYTGIDFVGEQNWAQRPATNPGQTEAAPAVIQQRLVLDAPTLRGVSAADGTTAHTDIAARSIELRNSSGRTEPLAPGSTGQLVLQALPPLQYGSTGGLTIGSGSVALDFGVAALRSTGDLVLQGSGSTAAGGDLTLSAARLTAASGAEYSISADTGSLRVAEEAGSRTLGERVGQGAKVTLNARTFEQAGRIDLAGGRLAIHASGTGSGTAAVSFDAGSFTSVAGFALPPASGFEAFGQAGQIAVSAAQGRIDLLGALDASAARRADGSAGEGHAGSIALSAAGAGGSLVLVRELSDGTPQTGQLAAHAGAGATDLGGRLLVDVATMGSADALTQQAGTGGFDAEFALRVRNGDVALATGVQAQRITLAADNGSLHIGAVRLDAAAPTGGVVQLAAGNNLTLDSGVRIDARSQRLGANGGDVLLSSTSGRISMAPGAIIDARGDDAQDGRIVVRAQRGSDNASVRVDALDTSRLLGGEVDIEAVRSYRSVTVGGVTRDIATIATGNNAIAGSGSASTGTLGQTAVRTDSASFMNAKPAVLATLGVDAAESDRVHLRAGVEVLANGNLTVANDWLLGGDRAGGDAGFLTLRAAGNLAINGSISDGFTTAAATGVLNDNARSWSYRLAAGADLTAANPLGVKDFSASPAVTGNLSVAAGRMVRTGAGSIEMAAGRDIAFAAGSGSTPQGMAYVAGRKAEGQAALLAGLFSRQTAKPTFTEQGGRLSLQAGRDITSAEATQLINNWFWRSGLQSALPGEEDRYSANSQLAWWTEFSRFRQTLGSFGGGDVRLEAGRDIVNVQAMAPTAGWADSVVRSEAQLEVRNGGDLRVSAGNDVLGGQFLVGRGEGRITAGGSISEASANARLQAATLGLMDGHWTLEARKDLATTGVFNPTAINVSGADNRNPVSGFFYTWGDDAALSLNASAGTVSLLGMASTQAQGYGLTTGAASTDVFARVMPATLKATAAAGDIELFTEFGGGGLLFPSVQGQLELWSGRNISLGGTGVVNLAMADNGIALWPDATRPLSAVQAGSQLAGTSGLVATTLTGQVANTALRAGDADPVLIHAQGTLESGSLATLRLAKQARISAGDDVLALRLVGQNLGLDDFTAITAGRNFLAGLTGKIEIGGAGALEVSAGHEIDLDSSEGISTIANQRNANLPSRGASIKLAAANAGTLDLAAFESRFLRAASEGGSTRWQQYRNDLVASVRMALGQPQMGYDEAWQYFQTFPAAAQAAFGQKVLAAEFGATYLADTAPNAEQMAAALHQAFDGHKATMLQAGESALAANGTLTLPGREDLQGAALASYLAELRALDFGDIRLDSILPARVASLARAASGWRETVAASLGGTPAGFEAAAVQNPLDPAVAAYRLALQDFRGRRFDNYRDAVVASEVASAGAAASQFGRKALPMRLALYDDAFRVAELAGLGSFESRPVWSGPPPVLAYSGTLAMTQSSVITERGGNISLVNAGGAINVGLKENAAGGASAAKGVIALGGGNIFGYARDDFQVNTQRVFIVGQGDMNIWSSGGDIDSGRGANTAVAAPPLSARRSVDGVVFEVPATTTGSGLGILEDAAGRRSGTIGLYPAFGEILALDAFIRAPSVVLGSTIKGADNLQAASVGGAAAPVSAPALALAPPSNAAAQNRAAETQAGSQSQELRQRNSLLTVDLLGLGPVAPEEECKSDDKSDKCTKPRNP